MKLTCLFLCFTGILYAQDIPTDYFSDPLEIPIILSGSFGELRTNHFHSGIDIKTQQREGHAIYAPADGYVSRIKVEHYGYGKALYLQHPNGYTTVYAHLQRFAGGIQEYVKSQQYQKETYTLELYPDAAVLPIKKGDLIAYSGNSGGSEAPHLHFEIRDAASRPMNPMLFGIEVPDTRKPIVQSVMAYPIGDSAHINQSQNPQKLRLILQQDGTYQTAPISAHGTIGFGIATNDQQNGASNKNGVYRIRSILNGKETYNVTFDRFSFSETRYLNRYIDYAHWMKNRSRIQKLFREANNPLSIIVNEVDNGYVTMEEGYTSIYTIETSDIKGNTIQITIPVEGKDLEILEPRQVEMTPDFIYADHATSISKGKFSVYIPSDALYENTYLNIENKGDTLVFHEDVVPIHRNITISVDASGYREEDLEKLFIGRLNYRGYPYYNTTYREGTKLSTNIRSFGSYALVSDTTPPEIRPVNFSDGKWISNNSTLKLRIKDALSGISSYRATLNGQFILMEYEYKDNIITYDFDDAIVTDTENKLKVIVVDNVGNSTTFEATFFRK